MGWDVKTCMHGKTENLDWHECTKCLEIAKKLGYDVSDGKSYIFTKQDYDKLKNKGDKNESKN